MHYIITTAENTAATDRQGFRKATVHIQGRWTFSEHATARTMIGELLLLDGSHIVINVSDLDYIDSAGIGMLLIAYEEMRRHGKTTALVGAQGRVQRVFQVARVDAVFADNLALYEPTKISVFPEPRRSCA